MYGRIVVDVKPLNKLIIPSHTNHTIVLYCCFTACNNVLDISYELRVLIPDMCNSRFGGSIFANMRKEQP